MGLGSPYGVCRSQRGFGSLIWVLGSRWGSFGSLIWVWGLPMVPACPSVRLGSPYSVCEFQCGSGVPLWCLWVPMWVWGLPMVSAGFLQVPVWVWGLPMVSVGPSVGLGSPCGSCRSQRGSGVPLGFPWVLNLGLGSLWGSFGSLIWVWGPPGVPLGP